MLVRHCIGFSVRRMHRVRVSGITAVVEIWSFLAALETLARDPEEKSARGPDGDPYGPRDI